MATLPPKKQPPIGAWVQTERAAHEEWLSLIDRSPLAAKLMHLLVARMSEYNAVIISQATLAELVGATRQGVQKALSLLVRDRWIEIRQIGQTGSVNAYITNARVAWSGPRDGIRYALFHAAVVASSREQPDAAELDTLPPLRRVPELFPGERQLPAGDGLPPPSEPALPGLEVDLPAMRRTAPTAEPTQVPQVYVHERDEAEFDRQMADDIVPSYPGEPCVSFAEQAQAAIGADDSVRGEAIRRFVAAQKIIGGPTLYPPLRLLEPIEARIRADRAAHDEESQ